PPAPTPEPPTAEPQTQTTTTADPYPATSHHQPTATPTPTPPPWNPTATAPPHQSPTPAKRHQGSQWSRCPHHYGRSRPQAPPPQRRVSPVPNGHGALTTTAGLGLTRRLTRGHIDHRRGGGLLDLGGDRHLHQRSGRIVAGDTQQRLVLTRRQAGGVEGHGDL